MANRLKDRIALVTGGGSGIGEAICRRFAEEGAVVVVNDLREEAARRVHEACAKATTGGTWLAADVADSGAVRTMFAEVARRYARLEVLVNNAGIALGGARADAFNAIMTQQALELANTGTIRTHCDTTIELSDQDWDRMLRVHLYGTFYCSREALKIMARQSGSETSTAKIINMGSIMGTAGGGAIADYCAAKAGILGFTRALAREVVTRKIQVNAIAPGFIETPLLDPLTPQTRALVTAATPQGRLGTPDDVAWAAVYLASAESDFVTGQVLSPNGGWHMSQ